MSAKSLGGWLTILLPLTVTLGLMGCASGTPKTEAWKFPDEHISAVYTKCDTTFPEATGSTVESLWANKRAILKQSRECSNAAKILADQAGNRNKVLGN